MLFYTGKRSPYPYSTRWLDEFDDPALAGKLYSSAFPLVDVTVIPDDEIAGHRSMAALTLLQKHIHQRDLAELVDRLAPILLAGYLSSSQVISLVHYIVQAGETADAEAFVRELAQRVPQHGDALMTIAQQLEQKVSRRAGLKACSSVNSAVLKKESVKLPLNCPYHAAERYRPQYRHENDRSV